MTRFTAALIAVAVLLSLPAQAQTTASPMWIGPYSDYDGNCQSLHCVAVKSLRSAYQRGEITSVRLNTQRECNIVNHGIEIYIPCTVIYPGRD